MKSTSIVILSIIILSVGLYLACVESPVKSREDQPETELISLYRTDWTLSSKPVGLGQSNPCGKLIWYNPYTMVATSDIWEMDVEAGETGANTFWMEYSPSDTGNISGSWAGIMQDVHVALDPNDSLQYLEFRIYGDVGIIHVDIGQISEDINGNDLLDTEDKPNPISGIANGIIDEGEDIGLDGLYDNEEPGYDEMNNPDPNGDNWWYNGYGRQCADCTDDPEDYRFINGTEGNALDPSKLGKPDTEDINRDLCLDRLNSYISYKIDLANSNFLVSASEYNGWKTYRIQLNDSLVENASVCSENQLFLPLMNNLHSIRFWFESSENEACTVGVASIELLGYKEPEEIGIYDVERIIRDYQYAEGRIFDLGRIESNYDDPSKYDFVTGDTILSINLYKTGLIGGSIDNSAPLADFYVDLDDTTNYSDENGQTHVHIVDYSQYNIHPTDHFIVFNSTFGGSTDLLGYYMTVRRADGSTDTIGNITSEPYSLKLIRQKDPLPSFITRDYEWRNVYSIAGYHIDPNELELQIYRGISGTEEFEDNPKHQDTVLYITILGLDRYNQYGEQIPDGIFDANCGAVFDHYRGLLIFPDRKPFASDYEFINGYILNPQVPEIYDLPHSHQDVIDASKYYLKINYSIYAWMK